MSRLGEDKVPLKRKLCGNSCLVLGEPGSVLVLPGNMTLGAHISQVALLAAQ